uniref:HAMP domain-containing sensor histidine kinase n=1 Tax=Eisenbergiella tayi TaxID=1432052 RepID=UPI003FEE1F5F
MEPLERKKKSMPLRKAFCTYVCVTFLCVLLLSVLTIWLCISVQNYLLPVSDEVVLTIWESFDDDRTNKYAFNIKMGESPKELPFLIGFGGVKKAVQDAEYAVTAIERNCSSLSPKRRLLYQTCGIVMILGPIGLSFGGILLCGILFYKRKLKRPIEILADAAERISMQDLDFKILPESGDELGKLCGSFEQMRRALRENYQKLWATVEERKRLQASVAHDLRNPIAIIEGHAEYLQINLAKGTLGVEKMSAVIGNILQAAKRLESYTESMRALGRSEEHEVRRKEVSFEELYKDLTADLSIITAGRGISLVCQNDIGEDQVNLDADVLYRILENLIGNAVRFAKREIRLSFSSSAKGLEVRVEDDGNGFPKEVLNSQNGYFVPKGGDREHSGLGLAICRILCEKHGGSLRLSNGREAGAIVQFSLEY